MERTEFSVPEMACGGCERTVENARVLADRFQEHGFDLVSGGTDTHLVLVDLRPSHPDTTGAEVEEALEDCNVVMNANTVPGETRSAFEPSGIRLGTPGVTTRGFGPDEMETVADCIARVVDDPDDEEVRADVRETVARLCEAFPVYE